MIKDDFLKVVRKMRSEYYSGPVPCHGAHDWIFHYEMYKRWAVNELEAYVMHCSTSDPFVATEEFRWFMDQCAVRSHSDESNLMFSTAYDVVTDILDSMITYGGA